MTQIENLETAIFEAERFITQAKLAINDLKEYKADRRYYAGIHAAAAKRASMDLTRSLAKVRK